MSVDTATDISTDMLDISANLDVGFAANVRGHSTDAAEDKSADTSTDTVVDMTSGIEADTAQDITANMTVGIAEDIASADDRL